jgi:hypothetical protein
MLCVNCDHPLPDGGGPCPGCGARPLHLLAAPPVAPSPLPPPPFAPAMPRRRRRRWPAVALLLLAIVVVALAGQASQSDPPATHTAPKGKAKAAHPTATHAPTTTTTSDAPAEETIRVAIGPAPDGAPDPDAALAAARAALKDWRREGVPLRETDGAADVAVQFTLEPSSQSGAGVAVVQLGDRACGAWSAYTQDSVEALTARAIGLALGRDGPAGPGELMDPAFQPSHVRPCAQAQGTLTIAYGRSDGKSFRLGAPANVSYTMQARGYVDVCLISPAEWDAFVAGESGGEACHFASVSEADGAELEAGDWILAFRCVDTPSECQVDYTLTAQGT